MLMKAFAGVVTVVSLVAMATESRGQTVYNDGGTHTVNGPSGPIEVLNGSTLNVDSPAKVTGGVKTSPLSFTASVFGDSSSTVNLNGGQVLAPQATSFPNGDVSGVGILTEGAFAATGGLSQGGAGLPGQEGGWGFLANGSVQISGGTFHGGDGYFGGLGAVVAGKISDVTISGGTFQGGSSSPGTGGGGIGLLLQLTAGSGPASITGGDFVGGTIGSGQAFSLDYQGQGNSTLDISGGKFSGAIVFSLADSNNSLNFFGSGFQLEQVYNAYWFSGTLADGNTIGLWVDGYSSYSVEPLGAAGQEEFSFIGPAGGGNPPIPLSVPEPSSLLTSTIGVVLIGAYRRMKKRPGPRGLAGR